MEFESWTVDDIGVHTPEGGGVTAEPQGWLVFEDLLIREVAVDTPEDGDLTAEPRGEMGVDDGESGECRCLHLESCGGQFHGSGDVEARGAGLG